MAVQAQHLSHPCNGTLGTCKILQDASLFSDERGGAAGIGNTVLSDLTFNGEDSCKYGFVPRKRARVVAEERLCLSGNQRRFSGMPAVAQGVVPVGDVVCRAVGSGAASTSARMGNAAGMSRGSPSLMYGLEIDALVRAETERMRAGLEEVRRRHVRALVAAAERAVAGKLRAAEAALEVQRRRNAELEDRLRRISVEGQAWIAVAKSHEAAAAGLRATIDQILQSPCPVPAKEGDADDAQSCCFADTHHHPAGADDAASTTPPATCKACGYGEATVLLLPCRHLCLCAACDAAVDTCPVCASAKNASLHVLLR